MIKSFFEHIKNRKFLYIAGIIIVAFWIFYRFNLFTTIDTRLQDYVFYSKNFAFKINRPVASDIIIVGADEASMQTIGRWPWRRDVYAKALDKMTKGKAAAVGIDILFTDASDPEADDALVAAVKRAGNVIIPSYFELGDNASLTENGLYSKQLNNPFPALKEVCVPAYINTIPDSDGVVRRTVNQICSPDEIYNSFGITIYKQYVKSLNLPDNTEIFTKYQDALKESFFDYMGGPSTYDYISFADVLDDGFPPEYFENKIVLIGPCDEGMLDAYLTPVSKDKATYGVEIWANIIQNLMDGTNKRTARVIDFILILLAGVTFGIVFRRLSPFKGAVFLAVFNGFFLILCRFIFSKGIILSLFYTILCSVVFYLAALAIRYIEEYLERQRVTNVFGRYVAPQIVDKILEEGEEGLKLGGTRKYISALFVDIRGFTPMSEKATPEEVVEILNEYLSLCASSIVGEGGTLDKFIGDAAMAIFNAPLDLEDHAFHAVKTALAMKKGSLELEAKLEKRFGRAVKFGIGINTGYAVVGNIGCSFRMDYTAIGDTVNTAARLESNAKPGQILISDATYALVKDKIIARALGSIKVKGKETEIQIYEVEGLPV